jgi:hypothetical protein
MQRRFMVLLVGLAIGAATFAASPSGARGARQLDPQSKLETNISQNGSASYVTTTGMTTMGEPEIAENPRHTNTLFMDWNSFRYPVTNTTSIPNSCGGRVSTDDGSTWQAALLPLTTSCADGVATYGPDGTLYAGGIVITHTDFFPAPCTGRPYGIIFAGLCIVATGYDGIVHSTDNGKTWSAVARPMGAQSIGPFPFAPGSGNPAGTFDRPWVKVDQSTNTVYESGTNIADHERFVTASTNGGKSFRTIYAVDSPKYPSGGLSGGTIAAAHGALAVAYVASSAPGKTCPCVIFETSTDHGATFHRHVVPTMNGASMPRPFLAADPLASSHFALTILDSTATKNQVYVTQDSGATWHGPTLVGEAPANPRFKTWISFGPSGQIALVWRTLHGGSIGTAPYDVWAAVGHDVGKRGAVFSAPVRVSSVASPYPPGSNGRGDDYSFVLADQKYLHIAWGDSRSGLTEAWYGRVPAQP